MSKRSAILLLASLGALLMLIGLAFGAGRLLIPTGDAASELSEAAASSEAQRDDLITPPSDRTIDWGIFRVIPRALWQQELKVLRLPTAGPPEQKPTVIVIKSMDEAKKQLPVIYQPTVLDGFAPSSVEGRRTNLGAYPIQLDAKTITANAFNLTMLYRHPDGRAFTMTQETRTTPIPIMNPGSSPRVHLRLGFVQGQPAVFQAEGSLSSPYAMVSIRWLSNGVFFSVSGRLSDLSLLRRTADSLQPSPSSQ